MARRRVPIVDDDVALPPYRWQMGRNFSGTIWGIDVPVSEKHLLSLASYRGHGGRWTWSVELYRRRIKKDPSYVRRIGRGVEGTLSGAKPAAEAAVRAWLVEQLGYDPDDERF